jgi:hypothetical protein
VNLLGEGRLAICDPLPIFLAGGARRDRASLHLERSAGAGARHGHGHARIGGQVVERQAGDTHVHRDVARLAVVGNA